VNSPTTRHASPAANPRTGRRLAALPNDPGLEALLADKRLSAAAKLVATVLVKHWAWYKPSCYPCNRSIAARCGYSPGHVARCLHELERGGWIRREQQATGTRLIVLCWRGTPCKDAGDGSATVQGDPPAKARTKPVVSVNERIEPIGSECPERSRPEASPTTFSAPGGLMEVIPAPLAALPPPSPAPPAPERMARTALAPSPLAPLAPVQALPPLAEVGPREARPAILRTPAGPSPHRSPPPLSSPREAGPTLPLTPGQKARLDALPKATANLVLTWLLTGDRILVAEAKKKLVPPRPRPEAPRTLPEVLARIREDPSFPALAADWLASALGDRKSYSGFKARCEEAWRGELNPARLLTAYNQAMGPQARNRGAIFMYAVHRE
jgi:hypothetical protein